ncbi:hypothetical protein [Streptomyces sp. NPDC048825]
MAVLDEEDVGRLMSLFNSQPEIADLRRVDSAPLCPPPACA